MGGGDGLGGDEVDAGVVLVGCEFVALGGGFVVKGGPGLASGRDVLAGVVADGAGGWGRGEGSGELSAAGEADGEVAARVLHSGWGLGLD